MGVHQAAVMAQFGEIAWELLAAEGSDEGESSCRESVLSMCALSVLYHDESTQILKASVPRIHSYNQSVTHAAAILVSCAILNADPVSAIFPSDTKQFGICLREPAASVKKDDD